MDGAVGAAQDPGAEGHEAERPKPRNSGMFGPELVNPNNPTVMKWKVCGEKQMLWLLQCYYIHKIYFIGGSLHRG